MRKLLIRPKDRFDAAMPSGNSAAAVLFDRLFRLTGKEPWRAAAEEQRSFISRSAGQYPAGCPRYALTAMLTSGASRELVCVTPEETLPEALKAVLLRYAPELTVLVKTPANCCRARGCRALHRGYAAQVRQARLLCLHRRQLRSAGGYGIKMDCRDFNFRGSLFFDCGGTFTNVYGWSYRREKISKLKP